MHAGLSNEEGRQVCARNCVCICGFLQPQPFIQHTLPQLKEFSDGFIDRLLLSMPRTRVLEEEELDIWCTALQVYPIDSLQKPLQLLAKWHADSILPPATSTEVTSVLCGHSVSAEIGASPEYIYTFSPEAMQVYRSFSNEMARSMNAELQGDSLPRGNISKDKTTMIRYTMYYTC